MSLSVLINRCVCERNETCDFSKAGLEWECRTERSRLLARYAVSAVNHYGPFERWSCFRLLGRAWNICLYVCTSLHGVIYRTPQTVRSAPFRRPNLADSIRLHSEDKGSLFLRNVVPPTRLHGITLQDTAVIMIMGGAGSRYWGHWRVVTNAIFEGAVVVYLFEYYRRFCLADREKQRNPQHRRPVSEIRNLDPWTYSRADARRMQEHSHVPEHSKLSY
jgi:hypothetical protein